MNNNLLTFFYFFCKKFKYCNLKIYTLYHKYFTVAQWLILTKSLAKIKKNKRHNRLIKVNNISDDLRLIKD